MIASLQFTAANDRLERHILVSIVAPFYNESATIEIFHEEMTKALGNIAGASYEFVCVNDGSRDDTLIKLIGLVKRDPHYRAINFSRNFGKEAAMTAGLDEARGDVIIPIDADLQDPPELIVEMIQKWREGYDVVLARRSDRASDTYLKRKTAHWFYRFQNKVADIGLPENVGDFRLMDRVVVDALKAMPERQRFMKGLFHWVGFKTFTLDYVRQPRSAGYTKFSSWKLWNFALEGITSFSTFPLRVWTYIGGTVAFLAFIYSIIIIGLTLFGGAKVPGYASMLSAILLLGGIQLIGIGVVGEYVGRIYAEVKQRPIYIIKDRIENKTHAS